MLSPKRALVAKFPSKRLKDLAGSEVDHLCNGLIGRCAATGPASEETWVWLEVLEAPYTTVIVCLEKGSFPWKRLEALLKRDDDVSLAGEFSAQETSEGLSRFPRLKVLDSPDPARREPV